MTSNPKPEALISTPADAAQCPTCMADYDARWDQTEGYEGWTTEDRAVFAGPMPTCSRFGTLGATFAHCDTCGSTDLVDTRSPFQVYAEALENLAKVDETIPAHVEGRDELVAGKTLQRMDVVERVAAIAQATEAGHCEDCRTWAVKVVLLRARSGAARF